MDTNKKETNNTNATSVKNKKLNLKGILAIVGIMAIGYCVGFTILKLLHYF